MAIWTGRVGNCLWTYGHGKLSTSEWEAFVTGMGRALGNTPRATTMLTVTYEAIPPNANERKLLADMLRAHTDAIVAHAMVTDSALVRGVLTALDWVMKKKFKESVFSDPRDAMRWLATFTPELHVTEVVLAITAAVPVQVLMPQLRTPGS